MRNVAVGLALLCGTVCLAQEPAPATPADVRALASQLDLDEDEGARFAADVAWARGERAAVVERMKAGELDLEQLQAEFAGLREGLRERLAVYLEPAELEALDLDALLRGPVPPPTLTLEGRTTFMPSTRLDGGGRLALLSTSVELGLKVPLTHAVSLTFGLRGSERLADFDRAFELDPLAGDPFRHVRSARASVGAQLQLGPVFAITSLNVQVAAEDGARAEDALTYGGFLGVSYVFSRAFQLGLGVLVRSRIEDQVQVLPLPLIRLEVELSEQWRFRLGAPDGVQLSFQPHSTFVATAGIGFLGGIAQDVRLDDRGFAPEGVARGRRIPARLELRWTPTDAVSLGLDVGLFLWQRLEIDDRRGRGLTDDRTDPTPYGALSLRLTF